ncbi:hypothetical protein KDA_75850 [Dictyobacter alpinus]|uniref:Uncharacterized protein n=1 Tax=Dictyobacter alpinus TaxID=2014873 RepID=A0A402BL79_9CHLR|nr:hypothetical protein [Dictyobacter alpinus]GCE32101.1 hypothetical protein KDA_75850 [Dictyobacter alpinus]
MAGEMSREEFLHVVLLIPRVLADHPSSLVGQIHACPSPTGESQA